MCVSNKILSEMIISTQAGTEIWLYLIYIFSKYFVLIFRSSLVGSWLKCFSNHLVEKRQDDLYNLSSIGLVEYSRVVFNILAI